MLYGQQLSNLRQKIINNFTDTIQLDTLSIIPETLFILTQNDSIINKDLYQVDYINAQIISSKIISRYDTIKVVYKVYPISFGKKYFHKDISLIKGKSYQITPGYYAGENVEADFLSSELNKSGSISRGISFGNQQDAVLNSNLNLQLSGKLNDELYISAAISDANIPIQPDGSSQQIQEFDKVFIRLYNDKNNLIAGDFELESPAGYFFRMHKKAKGAIYSTQWKSKSNDYNFKTTISGALSKGKYCRKPIVAVEGNQGPYRLQGCDNESYIIVLSGTEKIYIDGKLLLRGQENDYVINYNTAEITFTPNQLITKDKRITVEFEYSEQNYARFLVFNSNEF